MVSAPKIGDLVRLNDGGPVYLVVGMDEVAQTATLLAGDLIGQAPVGKLIAVDGPLAPAAPPLRHRRARG